MQKYNSSQWEKTILYRLHNRNPNGNENQKNMSGHLESFFLIFKFNIFRSGTICLVLHVLTSLKGSFKTLKERKQYHSIYQGVIQGMSKT